MLNCKFWSFCQFCIVSCFETWWWYLIVLLSICSCVIIIYFAFSSLFVLYVFLRYKQGLTERLTMSVPVRSCVVPSIPNHMKSITQHITYFSDLYFLQIVKWIIIYICLHETGLKLTQLQIDKRTTSYHHQVLKQLTMQNWQNDQNLQFNMSYNIITIQRTTQPQDRMNPNNIHHNRPK